MFDMDDAVRERASVFLAHLAPHLRDVRKRENFAQYFLGLMSPAERKSMEPLAALGHSDPVEVRRAHDRIVHFIGGSTWSDAEVRRTAAQYALEKLTEREPVRAWIVDDTGFLKQGTHSPGVQRMYTGSAGKITNCQIGVSLTLATETEHVPVDMDLYIPESWANDPVRRKETRIPDDVTYRPKWRMALDMIERAVGHGLPAGTVLADSAYGDVGEFRRALGRLGLEYAVGVHSSTRVRRINSFGKLAKAQPVADIARSVRSNLRRRIDWREGTRKSLSSRVYLCPVKIPGDDTAHTLAIEWRDDSPDEPKFTVSSIPKGKLTATAFLDLVMSRWRTERVYEDLKGELGLDHYEGRRYPGWQHHVSVVLCCAAFATAEKARSFPPSTAGTDRGDRDTVAA
jgi:SRSO17 transposase